MDCSQQVGHDDCRGALRSPVDERDWVFESLTHGRDGSYMMDLPAEFDLRKWSTPIRDQGSRGTCAAMSGAAIKEIHEKQKGGSDEWLSPEFIYYHRDNKPASGMYGRNVFQVLQRVGTVPEALYQYETKDNKTKSPTKKMIETAAKYRITNYARVDTIDGVKKALIELGPCYMSLPLYKRRPEFWRPLTTEKPGTGHATLIVGYNEHGFILRNSWGAEWNGDGHILFPYEDWPRHWECWVSIDKSHDEKKKKKTCTII